MILGIFKAIFYEPLYNALVFLAVNVPGEDLGLAIILLTIAVRFILFPLYHQSLKTQQKIKLVQPEIDKIKEEFKENKEEQTKRILKLYQENAINPFITFLVLLIQLPIILSLFYVFQGSLTIDPTLLYSFIPAPDSIQHLFLGLFDVTARSWPMAILVGATQFLQMKLAVPPLPPRDLTKEANFKDDLMRSMHFQMRYFMPVVIVFVAVALPSAISLYWITSNLVSIAQELIIRRTSLKLKTS